MTLLSTFTDVAAAHRKDPCFTKLDPCDFLKWPGIYDQKFRGCLTGWALRTIFSSGVWLVNLRNKASYWTIRLECYFHYQLRAHHLKRLITYVYCKIHPSRSDCYIIKYSNRSKKWSGMRPKNAWSNQSLYLAIFSQGGITVNNIHVVFYWVLSLVRPVQLRIYAKVLAVGPEKSIWLCIGQVDLEKGCTE